MKFIKSFLVLITVAIFFFFINFLLHNLFTLGVMLVMSGNVERFSFPMDYAQALRITTVVNILVIVPILTYVSYQMYTYCIRWFRTKPFSQAIVLLVNSLIISFVSFPFVIGMVIYLFS